MGFAVIAGICDNDIAARRFCDINTGKGQKDLRNIENYANEYLKHDFEEYEVRYRRKKVLDIIEKYEAQKILEIGCGMEPLFMHIGGYDFYCLIEPSSKFYNNALTLHEKYNNKEKRVFLKGFFEENKDVKKYEYDMVILSSLLHEIPNQNQFVEHIREVCNKQTVVHINVPNANSFHRVLACKMGLIDDVHQLTERNYRFQQHKVMDIKELRGIVERAGFEVIEEGSYFIKPFTHSQMLSMIETEIIDEKILDGLNNMCEEMPGLGAEIYLNCRMDENLNWL